MPLYLSPRSPRLNVKILEADGVLHVQRQFLDVRMAAIGVIAREAGPGGSDHKERELEHSRIGLKIARTLRQIGESRVRVGRTIGIQARRVEGRIDDAEAVPLSKKGLLIDAPDLDVVNAFHIGERGAGAGVRQSSILPDRL